MPEDVTPLAQFSVAGDTDGSATLDCRICPPDHSTVERIDAWHATTLDVLAVAARLHLQDVHGETCRACAHPQARHNIYGCMVDLPLRPQDSGRELCPCVAAFGGDVQRIAVASRDGYSVEDAVTYLERVRAAGGRTA